MEQSVFINNRWFSESEAVLHYRDLSIQRGYGIFDFFRVENARPVFLNDHLERFFCSAAGMHLRVPVSKAELKKIVGELIERNCIVNSGIRLTLTGGQSIDGYSLSTPNLLIHQQEFIPSTRDQFENGIVLRSFEHQRQLPEYKTIDYLMAIHLRPWLQKNTADEVLYYMHGLVTECPRANIFFADNSEKLLTPAKNILKGITRKKIFSLETGFEIEERDIFIEELSSFTECFITSSTKIILPVQQIDGNTFPQRKVAGKLLSQLTKLAAEELVVNAE